MPTSAAEYRKARSKEVTLPSTLADGTHPIFVVKKPSAVSLIRFSSALGLELSEDMELLKQKYRETLKTPEGQKNVSNALRQLLVDCVVEPKLTLDAGDEHTLCVDELDSEDQIALLEAILETSGLSEEEKRKRESFRKSTVS